MDTSDKTILVTGATGRQGGAVVRHLRKRGWPVRALTRNPDSRSSRTLAEAGVSVVRGDMEDIASLESAMHGAYGVFSVQDFWAVGAEGEIRQGKNMADAARTTGIRHYVFASVGGAERKSGIEHFESKFVVEEYIKQLKLPATILRPVSFMENYYIPAVEKGLLKGKLVDPIHPDRKVFLIATEDIGAFASLCFEQPDKFMNAALEIAGDVRTNPEIAEIFSRVMGRAVRYKRLPMLIVRLFMGKEFYQMFKWFNESGYQVDIDSLRKSYPEIQLTSLEDWLKSEGWAKKTTYTRHDKTWDAKSPKKK